MTTASTLSGYSRNSTVGRVCQSILFDQIQPYGYWPHVSDDPRGKPLRPNYPATFLGTQEAAKQWWEKNKHRTLQEMQLQVLDWVIAEEAKRSKDYTDSERKYLQTIRQRLVKRGKALEPGNFYSVEIEE